MRDLVGITVVFAMLGVFVWLVTAVLVSAQWRFFGGTEEPPQDVVRFFRIGYLAVLAVAYAFAVGGVLRW